MSEFRRHLPSDTSLAAMHVALGRLWDALEATGSAGSTASSRVNTVQGVSATAIQTPGTSGSVTFHNVLPGLQGGDVDNYYHLTLSDWTGTGTGPVVRQDSPLLLGTPTAPTQTIADDSEAVATTAFVKSQGYLVGPNWGIQKSVVDIGENVFVPVNYQHHILKSFVVYGSMVVDGESYTLGGVD